MSDKIKHSVLIVDDEERIINSIRRLLKPTGMVLYIANNGHDGLKELQAHNIALIISDQKMPGMTGIEFLKKSMDISPDSIRILLTGHADIEAAIDAINSGAVRYYLTKPWEENTLTSRIKESLEMYDLMQENHRLDELTKFQNDILTKLNSNLEQKVKEKTKAIQLQSKELKQIFFETIRAFSAIIELRHEGVGSHSQRVAKLTRMLIKDMGLGDKDYQDIIVAAFLHDIGKISFPDALLSKNRKTYSAEEWVRYANHPVFGQTCLYSINGFEKIGENIRHHHENYDGSGYPDRLSGDNIPLGARAIRIADAFDRMAFVEGHTNANNIKKAISQLQSFSGAKFDPALVKKFNLENIGSSFMIKDNVNTVTVTPYNLQENMVVAADIYSKSGMLLLPGGTSLTSRMITRLIRIHKVDPIEGGVSIFEGVQKQEVKNAPV